MKTIAIFMFVFSLWPELLTARVVDDCGTRLTQAQIEDNLVACADPSKHNPPKCAGGDATTVGRMLSHLRANYPACEGCLSQCIADFTNPVCKDGQLANCNCPFWVKAQVRQCRNCIGLDKCDN